MNTRTVFKYTLYGNSTVINTHEGAEVISAGVDLSWQVVVWMLVDSAKPYVNRKVCAFNTGTWFDMEDAKFVGTVQVPSAWHGADIVWHVFDFGDIH